MPTIGVYVPMSVARKLAASWGKDVSDPDLVEIVRNISSYYIEREAGIIHQRVPHDDNCEWAHLHRAGRRCRHCGGY